MDEVILNYIELSEEQRKNALMNLKNIGFYPAYGVADFMSCHQTALMSCL